MNATNLHSGHRARWAPWLRAFAALLAGALLLAGCAARGGLGGGGSGTPDTGNPNADKNARIRLELAEGYYQRGQPEVALSEVDQALRLAPDYVPAHTMRALIEMSLGQDAQAEASFRSALSLAPNNADALHNYGWFLCNARRFDESFKMFRRALSIPGYRDVVRTDLAFGVCQYRAGDVAGAEKTLRAGFALDASNPALSTNLALVLYREHRFQDALFYIRRVNAGSSASAQSLWLGVLIARAGASANDAADWTRQLVQRFPDSQEAVAAQQGRFDASPLLVP